MSRQYQINRLHLGLAAGVVAALAVVGAVTGAAREHGSRLVGSGSRRLADLPGDAGARVVTGSHGYIRATALGEPPVGMAGEDARGIARANAIRFARQELISAIRALRLADGRTVDAAVRQHPGRLPDLRRVLDAARVTGVDLTGGCVQITMTVPMAGPDGLGAFLALLAASS